MFRPLLIAAACVGLAACAAASGSASLPVCDGRHLRPANPNGSVLLSADPARALDLSDQPCGDRT